MKITLILFVFVIVLVGIVMCMSRVIEAPKKRTEIEASDDDLDSIALREINGTPAMISSFARKQEIAQGRAEIARIREWASKQDPKLEKAYVRWLDYSERQAKEAEERLASAERQEKLASILPNPRYTPNPDGDHEDVYGEVKNTDTENASQLMMWALRSDGRYKWVELRAKPGSDDMLLVVRHTKPKVESP